ncbi:MAG TPA: tRNA pseudouridine(13) synthase TruD [Candidatus Nanoarchaeia archaeon]|nr:tRNA pseudouridine(13) synthase TruD [Candidatus Nanoarchaeia archaeon]
MYVIKHIPEDFLVNEVSTVKPENEGDFLYFRLLKKDITTFAALQRISVALRVPLKSLSFAGIKDKKAITEQTCSVRGVSRDRLERLAFENMKLEFLGFGDEPVHLGDLEGNKFKIVVRSLDNLPQISSKFRNLFGEQRFSTRNADIGRHIVKREFEQAARTIAELYPVKVQSFLDKNDWVGAIRSIQRKVLLLFVHAYQSLLWNKAVSVSKAEKLPIVGFGSIVTDEVTKNILKEENLRPSDFVIREIPELSAEGSERDVWVEARDLKVGNLESDEFFSGKKKVVLEFFLPKGSYATEFIRQSFL